ncbi:MAG TPA: response regulator [Spirochaetales bacterium]|nr:response regulator [Spirochaetales bacterium]
MRIIIAEDERIIALGLSSLLGRLGHQVLGICSSGEACVELAEAEQPDVIFMDIRMDGQINGIDAARIIRSKHDIPIVFTTAFDDDETRALASDIGPMAFLTKPVAGSMLKGVLASLQGC